MKQTPGCSVFQAAAAARQTERCFISQQIVYKRTQGTGKNRAPAKRTNKAPLGKSPECNHHGAKNERKPSGKKRAKASGTKRSVSVTKKRAKAPRGKSTARKRKHNKTHNKNTQKTHDKKALIAALACVISAFFFKSIGLIFFFKSIGSIFDLSLKS